MKSDALSSTPQGTQSCDAVYEALITTLPGAAVVTDLQGQLLCLNKLAADFFTADATSPDTASADGYEFLACFGQQEHLRSEIFTRINSPGWHFLPVELKQSGQIVNLSVIKAELTGRVPVIVFHLHPQEINPGSDVSGTATVPGLTSPSAAPQTQDLQSAVDQLTVKAAQKEHAQVELDTVLNAVGQGIVQVSAEGRILMANRLFLDLFGYTKNELYNQHIEILLPRGQKQRYEELRKAYLKSSLPEITRKGLELWGLHRNGTLIPVEVGFNIIHRGSATSVVATVVDNTERKRQQKEILDKTRSLERSNEELKDFAYIATHDLKEPLRGISNYAMFLLEDYEALLDENGKDMIHSIVRLSGRMEQFITELLNFSRVGQAELNIRTVDLNAIVADAIDALSQRINALNVDLILDPLPAVPCDRMMVRQVFMNLISNALKYNDKKVRQLHIGCDVHNGKRVLFVKDNGIGIAKPFYDRIFKIFKRLHSQDRFEGGTGVGLSIVKKIVERHGGEIWLDSREGEGTTFYFTLT